MCVGEVRARNVEQTANVVVRQAVPHDLAFPPPLYNLQIAQSAQVLLGVEAVEQSRRTYKGTTSRGNWT